MKKIDCDISKVFFITDIHLGKKNNSDIYNEDCLEFCNFVVEKAKEKQIKTLIFGGDWHDIRSNINIKTFNYSIRAMEILSNYFNDVIVILGNHDLYHRERLDIHSMEHFKKYKNIHIIEEPTKLGNDYVAVPWCVDNTWKEYSNIKCVSMFGHFEISGFILNANTEMPDVGKLGANSFPNAKYVYTGHFHKRQIKKNRYGNYIIYTGNCFPQNFSDVNDNERGIAYIEHDEMPVFINWDEAPNYKKCFLSDVLEDPEKFINSKSYVKLIVDLELTFDEVNFIKDQLSNLFQTREMTLIHQQEESNDEFDDVDIAFESVDNIVLKQLQAVESSSIDNNLICEIYRNI